MLEKLNEFINEPLPRSILFFDAMLTPNLIRVVYWLGLLAVVWSGFGKMFSDGFFGFFEGIVYIAIGVILLRVAAELVMLLFKLNENMEAVVKNTRKPSTVTKKVAKKATKKVSKKQPS